MPKMTVVSVSSWRRSRHLHVVPSGRGRDGPLGRAPAERYPTIEMGVAVAGCRVGERLRTLMIDCEAFTVGNVVEARGVPNRRREVWHACVDQDEC